jgi:prenyltransferase beta subunit
MIRLLCLGVSGLASFALLIAAASPAQASPTARAKAYLTGAQNPDGGFGQARGERSDPSLTGWAALGLAAAGRSPLQEAAGRSSTISYLCAQPQARDAGTLARTLLVLRAAGLPTRFAGRDLSAELLRHRRPDGSFGGLVNLTAFGILATSSDPGQALSIQQSASWLTQQQNPDGGFSYLPGGDSGVDDTASVVQALVAAGRRESASAERAVTYLLAAQQASGGFASTHSRSATAANSMSTAWAIQALTAAGLDQGQVVRNGRTPIDYLRSLQNPNGSIRYSRHRNHNPVWATAQALPALTRRPFPLDPVPVTPAQATHEQQPQRPAHEADAEPSDGRGNTGPHRASTQERSGDGVVVPEPTEMAANGVPSERNREWVRPDAREESSFSPPERTSDPAQHRSVPEGPAASGSQGQPINRGLVALLLGALAALAAWWWRARRNATPSAVRCAQSAPTSSGDEVNPGPPDDVDRELAQLLAGESCQPAKESNPGTEPDRALEPHQTGVAVRSSARSHLPARLRPGPPRMHDERR